MKKPVWVVDDDEAILEVFNIILQEDGYNVEIIQDTRTIKDKLKKNKPGLIFLDLLMSGVDGRDIAKFFKNNPDTQNIPIIIMSADTTIEEKAKNAMADTYLKKPFHINDVTQLVKKYLK